MAKYQIDDQKLAGRYDAFADGAASLDHSIALVQTLIESAVNAKQTHAIANLLTVLSRLTAQSDERKWKANEVLHRSVIVQIAGKLIEACILSFRDSCPDWAERMEEASDRFAAVIEAAENPKQNG